MEILRKSFDFKATDLQTDEFSGYGAGIGNLDKVGDIIAPGSFTKTIPDFLENGFIGYMHDWQTPVGKPLDAKEDEHGLFIKARISQTSAGKDALVLLRDGVIKKLSIGFRVKDSEFFDGLDELRDYASANNIPIQIDSLEGVFGGIRLIKEVELFEVSLVTVPANNAAYITAVKNNLHAGLPFTDHSEAVRAAVEELVTRANSINELRTKDGRVLSSANRTRLLSVVNAWEQGQSAIDSIKTLLEETDPDKAKAANQAEVRKLYSQFLRQEAARLGV